VALKYRVALDSENHNQLTGPFVWRPRLVAEPADSLTVAVRHTSRNRNAERDRLLDRPFSAAFLTPFWYASDTLTRMTRTLEHSGHDAHVLHVLQHS